MFLRNICCLSGRESRHETIGIVPLVYALSWGSPRKYLTLQPSTWSSTGHGTWHSWWLTTQHSGSRAEWRKSWAMPVLPKLPSRFASKQGTDCMRLFSWQPYCGRRPLEINPGGMCRGMWVESCLLIGRQQDWMFEYRIVIGHLGSCWRGLVFWWLSIMTLGSGWTKPNLLWNK